MSKMKEKEGEIVEREGRMPGCSKIGQGLGGAGKNQNMSQVTFSQ